MALPDAPAVVMAMTRDLSVAASGSTELQQGGGKNLPLPVTEGKEGSDWTVSLE
uniref:Bm11864 n=1 Tax=Brugia malayi TaxID=6279 RepID=A0A1I9G9W9_BRUMA|nr:Bm11864 [Brugia malayi]